MMTVMLDWIDPCGEIGMWVSIISSSKNICSKIQYEILLYQEKKGKGTGRGKGCMRLTDVVTIFHLINLHKGQSEVWLLFIALFFLIKSGRKKVPGSPASPISFSFQTVAGLLVKTSEDVTLGCRRYWFPEQAQQIIDGSVLGETAAITTGVSAWACEPSRVEIQISRQLLQCTYTWLAWKFASKAKRKQRHSGSWKAFA